MLSGYPTFEFESPLEFSKKVLTNDWSMDFGDEDNPFDDISNDGKDFIKRLLKARPGKRFSAKVCSPSSIHCCCPASPSDTIY